MIYFLDASALVKRYLEEVGTAAVRALFRRKVAVSSLSAVEVPAALFRRSREGSVSVKQARTIADTIAADLTEIIVVEVRRAVIEMAIDLVDRRGLRAYDAMQLSCAVVLAQRADSAVTFVCADRELCRAAAAETLRSLEVG